LALASAAVSLFWTLGGRWLLDTVGGAIEELARTRSLSALALGTATSLAKIGVALLALALVRPWGRHVPDRVLIRANAFVSAGLVTWDAANVLVGALVLTELSRPRMGSMNALCWHVFVWDLGSWCGESRWRSRSRAFAAQGDIGGRPPAGASRLRQELNPA